MSNAFVSQQQQKRVRGVTSTSTALYAAAAPKKKKAKTAATKKKTATKTTAETFKKADFIASVQEKTGLSKTDSEAALLAVLDTITSVRTLV